VITVALSLSCFIDIFFILSYGCFLQAVCASPPLAAPPPQRRGQSPTHQSHAVVPAQFVRPANATHLLIRAAKLSHIGMDCIRANTIHPADFPHDGACHTHAEDCGKLSQDQAGELQIVFTRIQFRAIQGPVENSPYGVCGRFQGSFFIDRAVK
jgi:hypothetical protein